MARIDHAIHERLVRQLDLPACGVLLDLGCGEGGHLIAARRRWPEARLIGLDRRPVRVQGAATVVADLDASLPLRSDSVDAIVSHNLLECLAEPAALMAEAARVLRRGGAAVWSHTDFAGLVVESGDADLDHRMIRAYAGRQQSWMDRVDGRMARKLPGLVNNSPLTLATSTRSPSSRPVWPAMRPPE